MDYVEAVEQKIKGVSEIYGPAVGRVFKKYEVAELYCDSEKEWSRWDDLPIRMYFDNILTSVSWTNYNELRVRNDQSNPEWLNHDPGMKVRWVESGVDKIEIFINKKLDSVHLGRGQMSMEGRNIEIWTRLLLVFNNGCLEIYNKLDENGYETHDRMPIGEFIKCT